MICENDARPDPHPALNCSSSDGSRGTAAAPRPRAHRRGAGTYPRAAGTRPEPLRAGRVLPPVVRALRIQAFGPTAAAAAFAGERVLQGPGENAGVIDLGERRGGRVQGGEPQPPLCGRAVPGSGDRASAASSATSSPWARGRSRCWTACASASRTGTSGARWPASATTGTAWACRLSAARRSLTTPTPTTASSTRCASGCCRPSALRAPGRRHRGSRSCSSARRPGATASAARACSRARSWATTRPRSARRCRSATRSPASG